uniref:hypothetical protein n=1 Tax=uncultured Microbulbifer sp. TaxID=348147 RepID=UPI00262D7D45
DGEVVWSVAYKSYGNIALAHENQIEQPIRLLGRSNNYRYAPNPVRWIDPYGLSCKEGFAVIKMYKEGAQVHFIVEVHHNENIMITEQQSLGNFGRPAEIVGEDFSVMLGMEPEKIITIKLPDAQAAIECQKSRAGTPDGGVFCGK